MGGDDVVIGKPWKAWTFRSRKERGFGGTGVVKVSDRATRRHADNSAHSSFNFR